MEFQNNSGQPSQIRGDCCIAWYIVQNMYTVTHILLTCSPKSPYMFGVVQMKTRAKIFYFTRNNIVNTPYILGYFFILIACCWNSVQLAQTTLFSISGINPASRKSGIMCTNQHTICTKSWDGFRLVEPNSCTPCEMLDIIIYQNKFIFLLKEKSCSVKLTMFRKYCI